ncbi:AAA family ATPase [Megamonas sp.]
MKDFQEKIERYMDARMPILYIDTFEDDIAADEIKNVARRKRRGIYEWSMQGFFFEEKDTIYAQSDAELVGTLKQLISAKDDLTNKVLIIKDIGSFFNIHGENAHSTLPLLISQLKFLSQQINKGLLSDAGIDDFTIFIIAPLMTIPKELESYMTIINMDYLDEKGIYKLISGFVKELEIRQPTNDLMDKLIMTLKGLTKTEIFNILELAVSDDGELDYTDLALIREQKQQMIKKSGILDMVPLKESLDDIGGLEILKKWLLRKAEIFKNITKANEFGVATPKGVLIVGMPGCGKSLTAKAAAKAFDVPLLRLDMGRLMGKYVGESEANMRRAILLTEASSPCVLWIDELEKAFAGIGANSTGSEVTVRLFGNFLTWMQEKKSLAFVVATANDITKLPPELLRKGRFDEIFYVNLPNRQERENIFAIHIGKKRQKDLPNINMKQIVDKTEGYCGADIESIVHDSLEEAFVQKKMKLSTEDILNAIKNTHSISETMKEQLEKMAKNYQERKFKNASL